VSSSNPTESDVISIKTHTEDLCINKSNRPKFLETWLNIQDVSEKHGHIPYFGYIREEQHTNMCRRALYFCVWSVMKRGPACTAVGGGHFEHLLKNVFVKYCVNVKVMITVKHTSKSDTDECNVHYFHVYWCLKWSQWITQASHGAFVRNPLFVWVHKPRT
jgi:S-adenosylmethionine:tRNA-ribosyltransferase-isomerase (queuine synthetase)